MQNENSQNPNKPEESTPGAKIIDFIQGQKVEFDEQPQQISIPVSKLKLLPIDERMRLIGLIEANIGKKAKITLDHTDPKHIFVELHPEHVRMVKVGWLQNVDLDVKDREIMGV